MTEPNWFSPNTIIKLGVSAVIALFLVYQLAMGIPAISSQIQDMKERVIEYATADESAHELQMDMTEKNAKLLWGICMGIHENRADQQQFCNP